MPLPLMAIGGAIAGLGAVAKGIFGIGQNRKAKKIKPVWQQYQTNPYAKAQLGTAQAMFGGRMAGAGQLEGNIMNAQANTMSAVERNVTDSSQALALAGAAQGQTNESLAQLQGREAQNKYAMLQNLNNAYGGMINEGDKEYQSMLQKYQMDVNQKNALREAGTQNMFGAVSDLASLGIMGGQLGWFGGKGKKGSAGGAGASGGW